MYFGNEVFITSFGNRVGETLNRFGLCVGQHPLSSCRWSTKNTIQCAFAVSFKLLKCLVRSATLIIEKLSPMDLDSVKRLLERGEEERDNASIDAVSNNTEYFDPLILQGIQVDVIEPGRLVCSMKVPLRLLNSGNFLHGGATASLVDMIGAAAIHTVGAQTSGVSIEINVSYLDAAFVNEEIEIEAKVLRVGKAIGVVSVELRKKKTGKIIAQGRHTKYLAVSSKL